ncbi:MAG TPA: hypothetical protein VN539_06725, partial [Candidatus Saccharimonadales bacterium]|nr:hypothetical protein [Candidatus Saccharimonadales bacterium]
MISLRISRFLLAGGLLLSAPAGAVNTPAPAAKSPPAVQRHDPPPKPFYAPVYKKEEYGAAVSINDRCPVKHGPLNKNIRPSYVNRQTVGYCCHG